MDSGCYADFPGVIGLSEYLGDLCHSSRTRIPVHRKKEIVDSSEKMQGFAHSASGLEEYGVYRREGECVVDSRLNSRPVDVAESHAQIVPGSEMEVVAGGH